MAPAAGQPVCVLRVDGTWHADGARVGDAQQTRRGHARSSTQTRASSPSTHGSAKAPAAPLPLPPHGRLDDDVGCTLL